MAQNGKAQAPRGWCLKSQHWLLLDLCKCLEIPAIMPSLLHPCRWRTSLQDLWLKREKCSNPFARFIGKLYQSSVCCLNKDFMEIQDVWSLMVQETPVQTHAKTISNLDLTEIQKWSESKISCMCAASTFPGAKLSFQPIKWLTGGGKYRRLKIVEICQDFFNLTDHACRNGTYMVHCPNRPAIWCIHLDFRVPPGLGHLNSKKFQFLPHQHVAPLYLWMSYVNSLEVHWKLAPKNASIEKDRQEKRRKHGTSIHSNARPWSLWTPLPTFAGPLLSFAQLSGLQLLNCAWHRDIASIIL